MNASAALGRPLGPLEVIVNAVIQEMAQAQTSGIEVAAVLAESVARMPLEEGKRDTRKQRARRALAVLTTGDMAPYWVEGDSLSVV